MLWSTWNRLVQKKKMGKKRLFLRKHLTIIDNFEGSWLVGTHLRR